MSEWLLFNANFFQTYYGENKIHFAEMMSALYYTNMHSWIILVLVHWNNSPWVVMWVHSDTLSWFQANLSLFLLLYRHAYQKGSKYQFIIFGLIRLGLEHTIYCTGGKHANHYTTDTVSYMK